MISSESTRSVRLHTREFLADTLTPLAVYRRLARTSKTRFLFESVTGGEQVSRYSFIGAGPSRVYRLRSDRLEIEKGGQTEVHDGQPLDRLAAEIAGIDSARAVYPFTGGLVGYFGYDFVRLLERLPEPPNDPFDLPTALLGRFDSLVVFDIAGNKYRLVVIPTKAVKENTRIN